jgi:photosynthetic reaction center cytochrome c subunit
MKLWLRLTLTAALAVILGSGFGMVYKAAPQGRGAAPVSAQAPTGTRKAGEYFKNVTTSTLKELSVDDFIGAMGVMAAGLGYDCADCHPNAGSDKADFVIDSLPQKKTARRMVEMVASINREHFGGAQRVTCFTCHRNQETPKTTIALDNLYSTPPMEDDDIVPPAVGGPTADQILDKYIQVLGGAQKLAALTSFVATGSSNGYGGFGGEGDFTIYAKSPNQRATTISFKDHPERGESAWAFDGTTGWIKTPRGLLSDYQLVGEELDGERLEAQIAFPGQIKQALNNWRVGLRRAINNKDYLIVQGRGPRNLLATLYFDPDTGLLRRMVRYGPSPVGRVPTQIDYTDYRDVNGIKFPFEYQFSWLDGRYSAKIKDVKTNLAIDASRFGRPAAK